MWKLGKYLFLCKNLPMRWMSTGLFFLNISSTIPKTPPQGNYSCFRPKFWQYRIRKSYVKVWYHSTRSLLSNRWPILNIDRFRQSYLLIIRYQTSRVFSIKTIYHLVDLFSWNHDGLKYLTRKRRRKPNVSISIRGYLSAGRHLSTFWRKKGSTPTCATTLKQKLKPVLSMFWVFRRTFQRCIIQLLWSLHH